MTTLPKVTGSATREIEYENRHGNELGVVKEIVEKETYLISST